VNGSSVVNRTCVARSSPLGLVFAREPSTSTCHAHSSEHHFAACQCSAGTVCDRSARSVSNFELWSQHLHRCWRISNQRLEELLQQPYPNNRAGPAHCHGSHPGTLWFPSPLLFACLNLRQNKVYPFNLTNPRTIPKACQSLLKLFEVCTDVF